MQKTFDRIHIEITNISNVQCSFCPEVERPKHNMNVHQFEESVKQDVEVDGPCWKEASKSTEHFVHQNEYENE